MFPWKDKSPLQRAEQLFRVGKVYKASKDLQSKCCMDASCTISGSSEEFNIIKGDEYYSNSDGKWKAHKDCVDTILEPYHRKEVSVPTFLVAKDDRYVDFDEELDAMEEQIKYQADNWEPIVEDIPAKVEVSIKEAAKYLGVSDRKIYRLIADGKVEKSGKGKVLIDADKVTMPLMKEGDKGIPCRATLEIIGDSSNPSTILTPKSESNGSMDELREKVNYLSGKVDALENMIETLFKPLIMKLAEGK
jgi:excisionase family DNA binding protein